MAPETAQVPAGRLAGVVVTYHPERAVEDNIRAMVVECGRVIVVDNGSAAETCAWLAALPGVDLLAQERNAGLGAALNRGAERAAASGCEWIVTFDQDSQPVAGMVSALWRMQARLPRAGLIGAHVVEAGFAHVPFRPVCRHPRWPGCFCRARADHDLDDVTMVITSGSLMDLALWRQLGGFDEGLFIDYVDVDYCLRVRRAGRSVGVAAGAGLVHRLGRRQTAQVLGRDFRPMHHAAFRHYYMARNRVHLLRRHACAVPHWAVFDLCFAGYNAFRVVAFETDKWRKLKAIGLGTWDGLWGRLGPCSDARWQALQPLAGGAPA